MWWLSKQWWILAPGTNRQQWAKLGKGGKVWIYDARGRVIIKTRYPNRLYAITKLRRRGFRRLRKRDVIRPPEGF